MSEAFAKLEAVVAEMRALDAAASVMTWDQETYMPPGGGADRAEHLSVLARLAHEKWTADEVGRLLETLKAEFKDADPDSYHALYVAHAAHAYEQSRKLPPRLVQELARESVLATEAWRHAREADDFARFAPHLEKLIALTIEKAELLGYQEDRYDALLDQFEPGMPAKAVDELFRDLKEQLVPLVEAVAAAPPVDDSPLKGHFDKRRQWEFGMDVLRAIGYDLQRGRQDESAHPFTISFSRNDVRITTRIHEDDWSSGLFSTLHEAGHGMHAQGTPPDVDGTPLNWRRSLGISESQSRLWENVVGRSRGFWEHFLPKLKERFPQLSSVDLDGLYRAVNVVRPSLIRVEADELTYNLHIFVRFDLERELIAEKMKVEQLPEAWNEKMKQYLGVVPANDAQGVLQDIHWSGGSFGYFPTYTLGNVLSVQFYEQAVKDVPDIPDQVRSGRFDALRTWMNENVHKYGAMFPPMELVRRVTGRGLDSRPYMSYLQTKYSEIYRL